MYVGMCVCVCVCVCMCVCVCVLIFSQKKELRIFDPKFRNSEKLMFRNQHSWDNLYTNFQAKRDNFNFLDPNLPKNGFRVGNSKTNVWIRISILDRHIMCTNFRQNEPFWLYQHIFAQKWILSSEFQKSKSWFRISTSKIPCVPIFSQNEQLWVFWPKFREMAQFRAIFWF